MSAVIVPVAANSRSLAFGPFATREIALQYLDDQVSDPDRYVVIALKGTGVDATRERLMSSAQTFADNVTESVTDALGSLGRILNDKFPERA